MGGQSKSTQQQTATSQTSPYAPASGAINSILGSVNNLVPQAGQLNSTQQGAIGQIEQNATNPYAGQLGSIASNLLSAGGPNGQASNVTDALATYRNQLSPYANGQNIGPNGNPQLQGYLNVAANDARDQVNGLFAGAGRDLSGAHVQALARGVTQAEAPILANQYNTDVGNQFNAANSLYGAGNTTAGLLTGMNLSGADAATNALNARNYGPEQLLQAESLKLGMPIQNLGLLSSIAGPLGQAFGTTTSSGQTQGTNQMSGAQQFALLANGIGSLFPKK